MTLNDNIDTPILPIFKKGLIFLIVCCIIVLLFLSLLSYHPFLSPSPSFTTHGCMPSQFPVGTATSCLWQAWTCAPWDQAWINLRAVISTWEDFLNDENTQQHEPIPWPIACHFNQYSFSKPHLRFFCFEVYEIEELVVLLQLPEFFVTSSNVWIPMVEAFCLMCYCLAIDDCFINVTLIFCWLEGTLCSLFYKIAHFICLKWKHLLTSHHVTLILPSGCRWLRQLHKMEEQWKTAMLCGEAGTLLVHIQVFTMIPSC